MNTKKKIAAFCAVSGFLAGVRSRERRARLYLAAGFELAGAKRVSVVWRRRDSLICLESEAFGEPVRRVTPSSGSAYGAYVETAARWNEGDVSAELDDARWRPAAIRGKGPVFLFLPEGRADGAPRLFLQGKGFDRIAAFQSLLGSMRPHWIRQRVLRRRASMDPTTGAYNLPHFKRSVSHACHTAGRKQEGFALVAVGLDRGESHGHHYGLLMENTHLCHVATVLRRSVRREDLVARFGSDAFVILMRGVTKAEAVDCALRLKGIVHKHAFPGIPSGVATCSLGVTAYPDDGGDVDSLLMSVDEALSGARTVGEGTVVAAGRETNPGTFSDELGSMKP